MCGLKHPMYKYSILCCEAFQFLWGLSMVSLLPLWFIPSLPGQWVLLSGSLLAGLWWCHIHFVMRDLMVLHGMLELFLITRPWPLLNNFVSDLFEELLSLLHRIAWLVVSLSRVVESGTFKNRCINIEIIWQIMWHLGELYVNDYMTFKGNWSYNILFRGILLGGGEWVNIYSCIIS